LTFKEYLGSLKEKKVTVVGAGISNMPLIEALLLAGINTTVCDKRLREELEDSLGRFESLGAQLSLGESYLDDIDADVIFRTPGLMPHHPALSKAVKNGAVLTSEMEVFFEVCPCKKIGITGSDGKTTTTSIIAALLKSEGLTVHVGGNIGNPLLCSADEMQPDDIAVLELSSFQLITMRKCPEIAVVTNLSPNHLDVHKDMEEYYGAKRNIFIHQGKSDTAVFNLDNDYTVQYSKSAKGEVLFFSRREAVSDGVFTDGETIFEVIGGKKAPIMGVDDILLPGVHNVENYLAAFAAVRGLVSYETMRKTARDFGGVEHRIEFVRQTGGVMYYNDSIATSPSRTIAGLKSFDQKVILIAGGKDKGIPFDELGVEVISHVKTLVLVGRTAEKIKSVVENAPGYNGLPEIIMSESFEDAVSSASNAASSGDIVILSPACAAFDMFRNFEHRGQTFKELVRGL